VLSSRNRLRRSADFTTVVRRGRRAGRGLVTVHLLATGTDRAPQAGLVVSKAVGGSVVRSTTSRRLRHLLRERVPALPDGVQLVVRAAPAAGTATSAALGADLDRALRAALAARPAPRPA
jgi:ribonuclease P protein component